MAPRLSRPAKIFLAALSLAGAYIGATLFFDATAGAAAGVGGVVAADPPPLHVQFNNGGQTGYAAAVALSVRNEYLHGHTAVVLSNETCANPANGTDDCALTVELTVHASVALPSAVITNTSCGLPTSLNASGVAGGVGSCCAGDPNDAPPCGAGTTPQLNISVVPPASCDEHCGWFWLWFPCRCHAAAMLTVTVPHLLDYKGTMMGRGSDAAHSPRLFLTPPLPPLQAPANRTSSRPFRTQTTCRRSKCTRAAARSS